MRLVPYGEEHLALSLAMETNPEVMEHLGGPREREAIVKVHPKRVETAASGLPYLVIVDDSDEPAGTIGIFESEHDGAKIYEMGWMLLPRYQGRGLATEAGRRVIELARADPKIDVVHAYPATDNPASNAICRKLGFEKIGEIDIEFSGRPLHVADWRIDVRF
jgi:RimJ/RimL family protein N-acetyltransferase